MVKVNKHLYEFKNKLQEFIVKMFKFFFQIVDENNVFL